MVVAIFIVSLAGCTTDASPTLQFNDMTAGKPTATMVLAADQTPANAPSAGDATEQSDVRSDGADPAGDAPSQASGTLATADGATVAVPTPRPRAAGQTEAAPAAVATAATTLPKPVQQQAAVQPDNFFARLFSSPKADRPDPDSVSPERFGHPPRVEPADVTVVTSSPSLTAPSSDVGSSTALVSATYTKPASPAKKPGFFERLFSNKAKAAATGETAPSADTRAKETVSQPVVASVTSAPPESSYYESLPGVRKDALEITQRSGAVDASTIDANETAEQVQVASAAGLARIDPNGFVLQRETIDTACLRPPLLRVLKKIEAHYGERVLITSGYRSRDDNRHAHGARNSLHIYCAAADIQVPGVSKWELASYVRSMPGRGGVGTYCYTDSVHVDIGPERDWNWRCRRRKK